MADQLISEPIGGTLPVTASFDNRGDGTVTLQSVNGLDVQATVITSGSYQGDDFTDAVELDNITVASGSTDSFDVSGSWDQLQVSVDATTPTSGSADVYKHEPRRS